MITQTIDPASDLSILIPANFEPATVKDAILVSKIYCWSQFTFERREWGFFVPVYSRYLRSLLGKSYRATVDPLLESGVLEIVVSGGGRESYVSSVLAKQTGKEPRPKAYRLRDKYRLSPPKEFRIRGAVNARKCSPKFDIKFDQFQEVDRWHYSNLQTLTINDNFQSDSFLDTFAATRIRNGQFYYSICDYRRRHTPFTALSRATRRSISLDGQSDLVIPDVSSAQMLILIWAAAMNFDPSNGFDDLPELDVASLSPEYAELIELAQSGGFYEFIRQELGEVITWPTNRTTGRAFPLDLQHVPYGQFKQSCLIPLFCSIDETKRHPTFRLMAKRWPNFARYVMNLKQRINYQATAHLCQRIESKLMIDGALNELSVTDESTPILGLHDGLLTTKANQGHVTNVIQHHWSTIGLSPCVKA